MSGGIGGGGGGEGFDLDTKGQIHGFDTSQAAIDISGVDDYVLTEDSTNAAGVAWKENAHSSVTADSITTFTNKSIALGTNTITGSSAELITAISDETGSGSLVFGTAPTITLTNGTGLVATTGLTATGTKDATTYLTGNDTWSTIASGGNLELIDSDTTSSSSIWNSSTFSANMKTTYSELIVIGNMYWISPYTEFGDTYINLNGITSGYQSANGYYYDGTTMTQLTKAGSSVGFISDAAMDLSSGEGMHFETTLAQIDGTTNIINYHSICTSSSGTSMILDTFLDIGSTDIITDVKLQASLAGWGTGSNFAIYGRKLT